MNEILDYLDELYPNSKCELNYNKDYELVIATMLSAQTTDKRVNQVTKILFEKYPSLETLSNADIEDVKRIIRPIGTYNKKASNIIEIAKILKQTGMKNDRNLLESLPGVGRKTTNVVLSNIYNEQFIAVDTHVKRVSTRLGLAKKNDDVLTIENKLTKKVPFNVRSKFHHQMVLFGRYHCKAIKPNCENCKLKSICKKKD